MRTRLDRLLMLAALFCTGACAEDLPHEHEGDAGTGADGGGPTGGAFRSTTGPDGVATTEAAATDHDAWVRFDLDRGEDATSDPDGWDVGFRRSVVAVNGGASGSGGVLVAALEEAFDAVTQAPETGWVTDEPDGDDEDDATDWAFSRGGEWYDYDASTHVLTPRSVTYVARSTDGGYFKLGFIGYYDGAGTPGFPTYRWARVDPPETEPDAGVLPPPVDAGMTDGGVDAGELDGGLPPPPDVIEIDASSRETDVHLRIGVGVVTVVDPATSDLWDLAFRRTTIRTNSGTSGSALGGAREVDAGVAYEEATSSGTVGFDPDMMMPGAGPGAPETSASPALATWFDYDSATHVVSPRDAVFFVRTAMGDYARVRIVGWEDGRFRVRAALVPRAVEVRTLDVDAAASGAWTYVDLRRGRIAAIDMPAASGDWDVAFSRTRARTNGGTSGPGAGAAVDAERPTLSDVRMPPVSGFAVDAELPIPGPPGSGTYSGNPVLGAWYDYDSVTHVVSPRATVFVSRLADGGLAKIRIASWTDGRYVIEWSYAGAGRGVF
jgi:hypothetical protein